MSRTKEVFYAIWIIILMGVLIFFGVGIYKYVNAKNHVAVDDKVYTFSEITGISAEDEIVKALYVASGIGAVISFRACIAGAAGGCQAEIGSASAMAAGALVALKGGNAAQIGHAAAMTLKNLMGLVCDPVAGLVEVPCVKRNVVGAMNAVSCADMALAGVESRIPVDEVIDCMGDVGSRIPMEMRETALGGLAATPTGLYVKAQMKHN